MSDQSFSDAVRIWQDPDCCVPFIKGRVALYAILQAIGCGEGDEVVVPGFTCVVVPAAVCYTGAHPVFYDIDPVSLQGDPAAAERLISPRTRVVIIQHNFGNVAPTGRLLEICSAQGIRVIEDCAHSLGASRDGRAVGTLGTAAFCSLQWSKPTTTGLGGIARCNEPELADELRTRVRRDFADPSRLTTIYLEILSSLYRSWYRPSWYWTAQGLYRWAGRRGIVQGSSSDEEMVSGTIPGGYRTRFGQSRIGSLHAALSGLPDLLVHRRRVYARYHELLAATPTWRPPIEPPGDFGAALRYPLLVENRDSLLAAARSARIELGDWFNAPLHPQGCRPEAFGYSTGDCPLAEHAAARIINLPTHRHVDTATVESTIAFLARHAQFSPETQAAGNRA